MGLRPYRIRNVQLDTSYVKGGYGSTQGFNAQAVGLGNYNLKGMIVESVNGQVSGEVDAYIDNATGKLVVVRSPGSIPASLIAEETVTITANAGRLANTPAYILAVEARAGGTTGACTVVPTGSVLASTQCDVNFTNGNLKFFATDAVTSARVCYIPMGVGPFIPANQVIDELVTLPNATTVNLAAEAALVQYVYESTTLLISMPIVGTQNAPAAGQVRVQLHNSGNTTITDNAAQNLKVAKVTYWKSSAFGFPFQATDRASINATTNVIAYSTVAGVLAVTGPCIPAYGVHHGALATNTEVPSVALAPSGTAATASPVYDPVKNNITYTAGDNVTREFFGFIVLNPLVMASEGNEAIAGSNLSAVTIRATFIGDT